MGQPSATPPRGPRNRVHASPIVYSAQHLNSTTLCTPCMLSASLQGNGSVRVKGACSVVHFCSQAAHKLLALLPLLRLAPRGRPVDLGLEVDLFHCNTQMAVTLVPYAEATTAHNADLFLGEALVDFHL
jgi:hypothetical protein